MRPSSCLLLLLALGACSVQGHVFTAKVEKDERALIPISNAFGFGSRGHIDVTITNVAIYRRNEADDADLSKFGLFLSPWEAELDLEADMLAGKCLLDDRELTLFRFSEKNVKAVKDGQLNNVTFHVDVNNGGRFFLYFASCEAVTPVSFKARVEMYNLVGPSGKRSYLSVGETELSVMYWVMFGLFALATLLWGYALRSQRSAVQNIHWLMLALVVLKTLTVFAEALMYHFINIHGRPDGWNIVYYILTAGRGLLFFVVIILIGTGWSYMRPFLDDNTKKVLMVVLPLQVFANIAIIITSEESPAVKDWYTWRNIFHIVDVLCCCAILFPIVWSIKRLRDACEADGKSDGKLARSLEKLVLFRQFYIVVVMFIYFTRIVVFLLESTVDYQYQWTAAAAAELATLMFYTWMGVKFRPFQENAYLKLRQEEIEMGQTHVKINVNGTRRVARSKDVIAAALAPHAAAGVAAAPAAAAPPAADEPPEVYYDAIDQLAAEEDPEAPQLTDEPEWPAGEFTDDEEGEEGGSNSSSSSPFDTVRPQIHRLFLEQHVSNQVLHKQRCSQELCTFSERAQQLLCRCQQCGEMQQHLAADQRQYGHLEVYLCTQLAMHRFQAPMLVCRGCEHVQRLCPLHVGCFPGSASASGLRPGRVDVMPVWFSMDLLQHVDSSTCHKANLSTYSYVEARREGWLLSQQVSDLADDGNGQVPLPELPGSYKQQQLPLTADTLRRRLADAVREYQYAMAALLTLPESIAGWPTGKERPCAACKCGRGHMSYDMCFKLEWLARNGYTLDYLQPANSRRFISNSTCKQLLGEVDAAVQQQRQLTPAAAAAAAAIPARVPDLSQPVAAGEGQAAADAAAAGGEAASGDIAEGGAGQDQPAAAAEPDAVEGAVAGACGTGDCTNFKADRLLTPAPTKCLITGVGFVVCRHGHVWHAVNCTEGERHAYAIMSFWLLVMSGFLMQCWWYDINCRWMPSLLRWLQQQAPEVQRRAAGVWLPVPPWHLLAHLFSCRVKHGHGHMTGVGAGCGDVCEMLNSKVAPHGFPTRYSNGTNREARIEAALLRLEQLLDGNLPAVLVKLLKRSRDELVKIHAQLQEAVDALQQLVLQEPGTQQADPAAVEARVQECIDGAQRRLLQRASRPVMGWQAQYAKARLIMDMVQDPVGRDAASPLAAPLSLLFNSSTVGGLRHSKKAVAEAKKTVGALGALHFPGEVPDMSHPQVQEGLQQLADNSISSALEQLLGGLTQARYAEWVVQQLVGRPSAQRAALKRKHTLWQRLSAEHRQLQDWVQWAFRLQDQHLLAPFQEPLQQQLRQLLVIPLPLLSGLGEGTGLDLGAGSGADHAALKVYMLTSKQLRLQEEIALVLEEKEELVRVQEQRLHLLQQALDEQEAAVGQGACTGPALTQRLRFLVEAERVRAILAAARKVGGSMTAAEEADAVAATELMYVVHGEAVNA